MHSTYVLHRSVVRVDQSNCCEYLVRTSSIVCQRQPYHPCVITRDLEQLLWFLAGW